MMKLTPAHKKIVDTIIALGGNALMDTVRKSVKMRGQFIIKWNQLVDAGIIKVEIDYDAKDYRMIVLNTTKFAA